MLVKKCVNLFARTSLSETAAGAAAIWPCSETIEAKNWSMSSRLLFKFVAQVALVTLSSHTRWTALELCYVKSLTYSVLFMLT
jgi:hypothetical protein